MRAANTELVGMNNNVVASAKDGQLCVFLLWLGLENVKFCETNFSKLTSLY